MAAYVPVPWVSPLLYAAVLVGGLYYTLAGLAPGTAPPLWRTAGFAAGLAVLVALETVERRGIRRGIPVRAYLPMAARTGLITGVVALDTSGLAQALFVLLPFTAYFVYGRGVALALAALCVAGLLTGYALTEPGWHREVERVSDLLMLCVGLILALSMAAVAIGEQRGRRALERYAAQVAELSAAAERNRLARDIHDSLAHHLTAVSVQLQIASEFRVLQPDSAQRAVDEARLSVKRALGDVRQSVRALRDEESHRSLTAMLAGLARDGEERPRVTVQVDGTEDGYGPAELTALYRAAQEGLTNARRHAQASRVTVAVVLAADAARLVVTDDGRGFTPNGAATGFGLVGMRERVHLVGGSVHIDSGPGRGTRLTVTVPRGHREEGVT
ncbi:two-component sensor histidine kinase [Streptomyces chrestomyceticus JCM 4735]|uniref:Oxygen sensor histidine kinase NreB n=1 Tax=Streptomyces chrestomyceticus JCM 4735 TaxID=1306181 RepID=A0A7U9PUZ5_9ACTN|nr:sensor histidine kinase [Streptomyces chrestomyceticus]GCD32603.1 two-component sensor histidine kinase [Streptomyces chrestomyceticus JCM 4735]